MLQIFSIGINCLIFEKAVFQGQVCAKPASILLSLLWVNLCNTSILGDKM